MSQLKDDYMKALEKQLENDLKKHMKNREEKLDTVFIGGGTPSCIKANKYEKIFDILQEYIHKDTEITSEANPNSASYEWLEQMQNYGVNRISFGVQSFDDEKLKFLGRSHNKNSAIKAIKNAKKLSFNSINCDIIYGVQGDTLTKLKQDYQILKDLKVEHLSTYSLTIEKGTKFFTQKNAKIDDEKLSYEIFSFLEQLGFKQYEISNFSQNKQFQSKHNFGYWQHQNYLGVGAGAVGFIKDFRYYPKKDIEKYIKNPLEYEIESLGYNDMKVEKVLLGFRCRNGVEETLFTKTELEKVNILINEGKLTLQDKKIYNTNFLLADELALYILD